MKKIILFLLIILSSGSAFAESGTLDYGIDYDVPEFLGLTTLAYDGNDLGTYEAANAQCATDTGDVNARVCWNEEFGKLLAAGETFGGAIDEVWVNGGAPGYVVQANDCNAWSSVAVGSYGRTWPLSTKKANLGGCGNSYKYACCK